MTMDLFQAGISLPAELINSILSRDESAMTQVYQHLLNEVMKVERDLHLGAGPYERSSERIDQANGFKDKTIKTSSGKLSLEVPQTRNSSFYPQSIEKGCRSENQLVQLKSQSSLLNLMSSLKSLELAGSDVSTFYIWMPGTKK